MALSTSARNRVISAIGDTTDGVAVCDELDANASAVVGVADGYKVARGTGTTTAASTTVNTGLATVVACAVSFKGAPDVDELFIAGDIGDQNGSPAAGRILVKTYKPTAVDNVTPTASTSFGATFDWIAIGT